MTTTFIVSAILLAMFVWLIIFCIEEDCMYLATALTVMFFMVIYLLRVLG